MRGQIYNLRQLCLYPGTLFFFKGVCPEIYTMPKSWIRLINNTSAEGRATKLKEQRHSSKVVYYINFSKSKSVGVCMCVELGHLGKESRAEQQENINDEDRGMAKAVGAMSPINHH